MDLQFNVTVIEQPTCSYRELHDKAACCVSCINLIPFTLIRTQKCITNFLDIVKYVGMYVFS